MIVSIRLPEGLVENVDSLVKDGMYSSRSDVVKDAVRKLVAKSALHKLVGLVPGDGKDSTKKIRELRNKLSKEIKSAEDLKVIDDLYS